MRIIYKPHSYRRFPKTETMDACMRKYKPHAFLRSLTKTPAKIPEICTSSALTKIPEICTSSAIVSISFCSSRA